MSLVQRWRDVSIARKLYFVVGIMGVLIVCELLTLRFAMHTLSAARAFVGGEGLWSKAQKNALISLERFGRTRDEADYSAFLGHLAVPEGDHEARLELMKPSPDRAAIHRGFRQGRIEDEDIDPMIDLLQRFAWEPHLARSIAVWTEGDMLLDRFRAAAGTFHEAVVRGDVAAIAVAAAEVEQLNLRLTTIEDEFSFALGAGSRWLEWVVLSLLTIFVLIVESIGLTLAILTSRGISRDLGRLNAVALRIGGGDFSAPVVSTSKDEIGQLARAVAQMGGMLQTRDQLGVILGGIADGITVIDAQGKFVYANEAGARMCGAPSVDAFLATPQKWYWETATILDEEGNTLPMERLPSKLAFAGVAEPPEVVVRSRLLGAGEERSYLVKSAPVLDENGRTKLVVTILKDVTDHRRAEDAVKFLDHAAQILASSMDWRETLQRVGELAVPRMADGCFIDVVGEDGQPGWTSSFYTDAAKATLTPQLRGRYSTDRTQLHTGVGDGVESVIVVPLVAREKRCGAIVLVTAESRRRYGTADLNVMTELARRAGNAIENAILYQLAQKAIHARDEFLSIASHELKTPLTSLSLQLEMVQQKLDLSKGTAPPMEKIARVFDVAGKQVARLTRLVEDLLDVSRIEVGKLSFHFERVDLAEIVRGVVSRFAAQLTTAGSELALEIEDHVMGPFDQIRVEQVVDNLLSNAVKYASGKPVTVTLAKHGDSAMLVVEDHGPGVPPDEQTRIFERFERGAASASRASGLGLGLFIAKEIVSGHGGSIRVESPSGSGSRFVVEWPVPPPGAHP